MARKNRKDLVGLAALAGLGMLMANRKKDSGAISAGSTASASPAATKDTSSDITDDMRKRAKEEGEKISEGERVSNMPASKPANKPTAKPDTASSADTAKPAATAKPSADTAKPAATAKPSAATGLKNPGTGNQRGPTAEELTEYEANRNVNFGNESRRTPMGSTPATKPSLDVQGMNQRAQKALADDPSALAGPAAGLGYAGYRVYKYGKSAYDAAKAAKAAERTAAAGRESVTNPLSWMAGPKNAKNFDEAAEVASKGRESVTNPLSWMAGPKNADKFKEAAPSAMDKAKAAAEKFADRFRKKPLNEADTTGGAIGYKRGGKVRGYASGGSVSSASSRADGIATKGKTRGKIY